MKNRKTVLFPMSVDITSSAQYNFVFKNLEQLQNFFWNTTEEVAQELCEIFEDDNITLVHLVNYPSQYNIGLADTSKWVTKL